MVHFMSKKIILLFALLFVSDKFLLADEYPTQRKSLQLMAALNYQSLYGSWYEDSNGNDSNFYKAEIGVGYFLFDNFLAGLGFSFYGVDSSVSDSSGGIMEISVSLEYYLRYLIQLLTGTALNNFLPFLFVSGDHRLESYEKVYYQGTPARYKESLIIQVYGYGYGIGMLIMLNKYVGLKPFFSYHEEYITQIKSSIELNEHEKSRGRGYVISPGLWLVGVIY